MAIQSRNPATGELRQEYREFDADLVDRLIQSASETQRLFGTGPLSERVRLLQRTAEVLEERQEALARLMTEEMGKPIVAARQEVAKCATTSRFYAEHGPGFIADETVETEAGRSYVKYQPLGVVLAVMPWNFPLWQVIRCAAPALLAGNTVVLKHASNVPELALTIQEVFEEAGWPDGAFTTLLLSAAKAEALLSDDRIAAASLTGSEGAGRKIGAAAGAALKKVVLELGGSDPFLVMPSADLDKAVKAAVQARLLNNGQSCIAAKRFIVHESVYAEFLERFTRSMETVKMGDPLQDDIQLGPLATAQLREELHKQVLDSKSKGAKVVTGGAPVSGPGYFYLPTVLTDIPVNSPARDEELFGPVASVFCVPDLDAALELANETHFGLGASLWSHNEEDIRLFQEKIEAGSAFVNAIVASDPRLPFGGIKRSGYGRELGPWGIREFTNVKTVWIA